MASASWQNATQLLLPLTSSKTNTKANAHTQNYRLYYVHSSRRIEQTLADEVERLFYYGSAVRIHSSTLQIDYLYCINIPQMPSMDLKSLQLSIMTLFECFLPYLFPAVLRSNQRESESSWPVKRLTGWVAGITTMATLDLAFRNHDPVVSQHNGKKYRKQSNPFESFLLALFFTFWLDKPQEDQPAPSVSPCVRDLPALSAG